jgi:hypothetical protein
VTRIDARNQRGICIAGSIRRILPFDDLSASRRARIAGESAAARHDHSIFRLTKAERMLTDNTRDPAAIKSLLPGYAGRVI